MRAKEHLKNIIGLFRQRALYVLIFAAVFGVIGYGLDKLRYDTASAEEFIDYYDFTVNNAREGETVFFKVCRRHDMNYRYKGDLAIYIVPNPNDEKENVKVKAIQLEGQLRDGECENKRILAEQYFHESGNYTMSFCVSFRVKYDFEKSTCYDSNIYSIYPQPDDVKKQINTLKKRIKRLQEQGSEANDPANTPSDLFAPTPAENKSVAPKPKGNNSKADDKENPEPPAPAPSQGLIGDDVPFLGWL